MKNNQNEKINKEGFTLFIAVIVTSLLLAIGLSISSIILKQLLLSSNGQNSQYAFYAADAATECALFWSSNATTTSGGSAFPTSSQSYLDVDYLSPNEISCNGYLGVPAVSSALTSSDINQATTSFYMAISPTTCALVTVYRSAGTTTIDARGYNEPFNSTLNMINSGGACDITNSRTVERGVHINL